MTKKEIDTVLVWSNSVCFPNDNHCLGVSCIQVFLSIKPLLKNKLYWYALRRAYESSDNLFLYRNDTKFAFLSNESGREFLMTKKEREYLKKLPEKITIYRGMTKKELKQKNFGVSWTLKKEIAEFFANKYERNFDTNHLPKIVHQIDIDKKDIIAFLNDRNEFEIVYINDSLTNNDKNGTND
jgi:hypothetical protein